MVHFLRHGIDCHWVQIFLDELKDPIPTKQQFIKYPSVRYLRYTPQLWGPRSGALD